MGETSLYDEDIFAWSECWGERFDFIEAASALAGASSGLEEVELSGALRHG